MRLRPFLLLACTLLATPLRAQPRTFVDSVQAAFAQLLHLTPVHDTTVVTQTKTDTLFLPAPAPTPAPPVVVAAASDSLFLATLPLYMGKVASYGDAQWARTGTLWSADGSGGNYYDRCSGWLQFAASPEGADSAAKWRTRALGMCDEYRNKYLVPNAWRASPQWGLMEGQLAEWQVVRTTNTALADSIASGIKAFAASMWSYNLAPANYVTRVNGENRILARMEQSQTMARRLSELRGDTALARTYRAREDTAVTRAEAWIQPDGSYPADGQVCGGQLNYMVGHHSSIMIDMLRDRPDLFPRVLTLVRRSAVYVQTTQARPQDGSLNYASVDCSSKNVGGPTASPDLNSLWVDAAWWLYQQTGDARWQAWGDALFAVGVKQAYWTGGKQYNEQLVGALRGVARRRTLLLH